MPINWAIIYNRLFDLIDRTGEAYFSGGRFIEKVREVDPYFPTYSQHIAERQTSHKSTSRKDYFYDILLQFDESARMRIISTIVNEVEHCDVNLVTEIRALMDGLSKAPRVVIHPTTWNANRLNGYLAQIDASIAANQYERAVSLSYMCLEGFYEAFLREKDPSSNPPNGIIALSRQIRNSLREIIADYPDEVLNLINHVSHAVDRARNRFSEAHFGSEAGRWLATYIRDLVNSQIRLLLHFMGR
jgi:hypothetical protein